MCDLYRGLVDCRVLDLFMRTCARRLRMMSPALSTCPGKKPVEASIDVKEVASARDVGIDATAGRKRWLKVSNHRLKKSAARSRNIGILSRQSFKACRLFTTGASSSARRNMRANQAHSAGITRGGLCTTTAIHSLYGEWQDPDIKLSKAQATMWATYWHSADLDERTRRRKAWRTACAKLCI